jgi:hypothetical protein
VVDNTSKMTKKFFMTFAGVQLLEHFFNTNFVFSRMFYCSLLRTMKC